MHEYQYPSEYLERRRVEIDTSEWLDILNGLRAVGARPGSVVVEWGAGEGLLVRFLRAHGYRAVGFDLLYHDPPYVYKRDVTVEPYPLGEYCVSQHFLEHIPQDRAVKLLRACLDVGVAAVNIVPGHDSDDPTHVVNHYTREMLEELAEAAGAPYHLIVSDTHSYAHPPDNDWILILSNRPINTRALRPLALRLLLRLLRRYINWRYRAYRIHHIPHES